MNIEQKVAAYDEALERAKNIYGASECKDILCTLETIFPELKESDDEKIRKELLKIVKESEDSFYMIMTPNKRERLIAWLEKQGCQKSVDNEKEYTFKSIPRLLDMIEPTDRAKSYCKKLIDSLQAEGYYIDAKIVEECLKQMNGEKVAMAVMDIKKQGEQKETFCDNPEPKFKVGDWVVWDNKISCHIDNIYQGKESLMYTITDAYNMTRSYAVKGFDNNAHLWNIQDAKDGDVLTVENMIFVYKTVLASHVVSYCKLFNNKFEFFNDIRTCCEGNSRVHPATKEQRDLLFSKMKEAGYEWDAEKKELKKIEDEPENYKLVKDYIRQKPTWSEEDSPYYDDICEILINLLHSKTADVNKDAIQKDLDWLNSLKYRVQPQPQPKQGWSEEDENCLSTIIAEFSKCAGKSVSKDEWMRCNDFLNSLRDRVKARIE